MQFNRGKYPMVRRYAHIAIVAVVLGLAGCSSNPTAPVPTSQLKLGFTLQSSELASLVTSVTLTMQYPDTIIVQTLTLVEGGIHDTLVVNPSESIVFTLRAFDSQERLLYIGSATRSVAAGQRLEVQILLVPNPDLLMLRAGPLFQSSLLATDDLISVSVDVYNVDSLAGAAFRIRYDTLSLRFAQAAEGSFLRGTTADSTTFGWVREGRGFIAFTGARVPTPGARYSGVSGSGRLVTFFFSKQAAGTSPVTIDPETVSLVKPDGKPVNHFASLVRESATVEIR
ncbi:MAG: hypothetical protein HZB43_11530 [candidate division Zixibacteria bacterium]|nr:hypothetical protein [candidate division Zixibacteria bacterium]